MIHIYRVGWVEFTLLSISRDGGVGLCKVRAADACFVFRSVCVSHMWMCGLHVGVWAN